MNTGIWIFIVILALIGGGALGFFIARSTMKSYMEKNPPIDEKIIRVMYMQMGITPSQKRINQVLAQVKQTAGKKEPKAKKGETKTKKTLSGKVVSKTNSKAK